jgi:hypothetical protein
MKCQGATFIACNAFKSQETTVQPQPRQTMPERLSFKLDDEEYGIDVLTLLDIDKLVASPARGLFSSTVQ